MIKRLWRWRWLHVCHMNWAELGTKLCGSDRDHLIQCWAGSGPYVGEQGLFQLADFTSGGKDRVVLIINIEPFFVGIADLLGEPMRRS